MSDSNSPEDKQKARMTASQWLILALLVLLNVAVVVVLVLALTGRLTL